MGKKKNKALTAPKLKLKSHDVGKEQPGFQFVVVVDLRPNPVVLQAWFSAMFKDEKGAVKHYYVISTSNVIIVCLDAKLDVEPILGAHYWKDILPEDILEQLRKDNDDRYFVTTIYRYNYQHMGDPASHLSYKETTTGLGKLDMDKYRKFPRPYPPRYWAKLPEEKRASEMVLPLPRDKLQPRLGSVLTQELGETKPHLKNEQGLPLTPAEFGLQFPDIKVKCEQGLPLTEAEFKLLFPAEEAKVKHEQGLSLSPDEFCLLFGNATPSDVDSKPGLDVKPVLESGPDGSQKDVKPELDVEPELDVKPKLDPDARQDTSFSGTPRHTTPSREKRLLEDEGSLPVKRVKAEQ